MSRYNKLWAALVIPLVAILFAAAEFIGAEIPFSQEQIVETLSNIGAMLITALFVYIAPANREPNDA